MIKELVKLADHFDREGLQKEADMIDSIVKDYSSPRLAAKTAKKIFSQKKIDGIDLQTLRYIRDNYEFTDEAGTWFDKKLNELRA